jgi:uncharacterized protein (DUF2252 family)
MSNITAFVQPSQRQRELARHRNLKMARSAHAYVRGSTGQFYEWLKTASGRSVPQGPKVWICGDCHVGNLGPVADAKGKVAIAIRDLDQTVIGNPAHDLIRLGLSLATAIRSSDLPGVTTALMLEQMVDGYEMALSKTSRKVRVPQAVEKVLAKALKRRWHHLAEERISDVKPNIPLGQSFWPLSKAEEIEIEKIFRSGEVRGLVTSLQKRDDRAKVRVMDAAYWLKGCSSLGRLRFAVLLRIGKKHRRSLCIMDIKEAVLPASPRSQGAAMPNDNAQRVVEGARHLSPCLGQRMLPWKFLGRSIVIRELLPQDLKLEMDQLTRDEAITSARYLASVVGLAHSAQMEPKDRRKWLATLKRSRLKKIDTPSWLWTSVVELSAMHESAYLEHCRTFAIAPKYGKRA